MNRYSIPIFKHLHKTEAFILYIILFSSLVGCKGACSKYKCTQYVDGMYYPNGTVKLEGRPVGSPKKRFEITISHPFRVTEIGDLTPGWYEEPWGNKQSTFEVAKAEVFKTKSYYISLYELYSTGRFEYSERSITLKEWIKKHPFWTIIISIILLIIVLYLITKYANKQTRLIILISSAGVAIILLIVYWDDVIKLISGIGAILLFAMIGAAYDKANNSTYSSVNKENNFQSNKNHSSSKKRCTKCRSIDMSTLLISKGDGRCKACDGTGHDRTSEAIVGFGSLGLVDGKINCETCNGTGQCQTCGGTGFIYF